MISIGLAIISLFFSIYIFHRDRSNLQIEDFHLGLGGSRKSESTGYFQFQVSQYLLEIQVIDQHTKPMA